ncbi:MAG: hypothetical protein J6S58_00860 [Lentisphaeria bacterium]|nr:hypothetical protein [Lentisphaeria bacterium]
MKKSIQLFCVIFLWLGALLPVLYGGSISSCENILFTDGKAMLEKTTKCVYNASFSKGSPIGKPTMNYRNKTAFTLQKFKGRESLVITPADGKKSSAWGVRVAPFAVEGGREFLLEMDVCGSVSMLKGSGRINYSNYYFFLDKENRICRDDGFFYYETLSDQWITSKVSGRIPADSELCHIALFPQ